MAVIEGERASARRERLLGATPGAFAQARFVGISAMKARRVINLIRGRTTTEAMTALRFAPQVASQPIAKVLASAVANAQNNEQLDPELLLVAAAFVDEGPTAKRIQPRAQGRAYRIRKRSCHITIVVESVEAGGSGKGRKRVTRSTAAVASPVRKPARRSASRQTTSTATSEVAPTDVAQQPTAAKSRTKKTTAAKPTGLKSGESKATAGKSTDVKATDSKATAGKSTDVKTTAGKGSAAKSAAARGTGKAAGKASDPAAPAEKKGEK